MFKSLVSFLIISFSTFLYSQEYKLVNHDENKKNINNQIENIKDIILFNGDLKPLGNSGLYFFEDKEGKLVVIDKNGEYFFRTTKQEVFKLRNKKIISKPDFNVENTLKNYEKLKTINRNKLIQYLPEKYDPMKELFVFIDYTCPYCKDFHEDVLTPLQNRGYTVNYLPIARNFRNNNVINNLKIIFCNKDKELLNKAFKEQGRFNTDKKCENDKYYI